MHYPQIILFRKVLYGLLALHGLVGAFLLYAIAVSPERVIYLATIGLSASIFYLVLLITLINYVTYLDDSLGRLQNHIIRLDKYIGPERSSSHTVSSPRSRSSLSDRLGKL
jgi:hypothetical protein